MKGMWRAWAVGGFLALAAAGAEGAEDAAREMDEAAVAVATATPVVRPRLRESSAMPVGAWLMPPPGYLDYCLRHRARDPGCRS